MTTWWGLFSSTHVRSSNIYWYAQKNSGYDTANLWEIYFYLLMYLLFFVVFLLSIMSIFTSAFQRVCVCFYYSIYFSRDYGISFISWTSINSWFLKFSLTQTNRTCRLFTSLGSAWFKWSGCSFFSHFWHCIIFNFNGVRTEMVSDIYLTFFTSIKKILTIFSCIFS